MKANERFDIAIVGAGVFGIWTAYQLSQSGMRIVVLDAYGPGNSRSSSGGESRVIRLGYGADEIYSRSAQRSFQLWRQFFELTGESLFYQTGVLWLANETDSYCEATIETLALLNENFERLTGEELRKRYPQFNFDGVAWGIIEPDSGALMARRAVQNVAAQLEKQGMSVVQRAVLPPMGDGKLASITTTAGETFAADKFVFACGPWFPKLFGEIFGSIMNITRQEVFFFGTPAGDRSFTPEHMPIWVDFNDFVYAIPNLENRGFKIAIDAHGPIFDPDTGERVVSEAGLVAVRQYMQRRVPSLANAPVTETRVCQYENSSNGDFLIDRHPAFENVWLVGGGSGHGFKHGPAVGEYVANLISGEAKVEPRFLLSTKESVHHRQVF